MSPKAKPISPRTPFKAARSAGVPIVAIETADPAATIEKCVASLNGKHKETPLLKWDLIRGLSVLPDNEPGMTVLSNFTDDLPMSEPSNCLATLVSKCKKLSVHSEALDKDIGAIVFMIHPNRFLDDTGVMQAVWNCRDAFEPIGAMLVLLGPSFKIPIELKNDLVLISEPLPDAVELGAILDDLADDAALKPEAIDGREVIIDTMSGTSAFGARQILAMSLTKDGIDKDCLWERKRKMIEQTDGLSVWKGGNTFADIGGIDALKADITDLLTSATNPVRALGFWDEIEKGLASAGAGGDLSGTSQDALGVVLKAMADFDIPGIILLGHAGTGKSEIAKGAGNVIKGPVIAFDTGAMKNSLVGGSESRIRGAIEVFKAVSQGKGFFIATCNKISTLPPELRRRFRLGTYFVDLPTAADREKIWDIWIEKFGLKKGQSLPDASGWTGAEISACCDMAFRTGRTLKEAAKRIVPIIKSAPEAIASLRQLATNRFIDATTGDTYQYREQTETETKGRKIDL